MESQYADKRLKSHYNLVAVDHHFHGQSRPTHIDDTPYDFVKNAQDMFCVLDALEVRSCHLFGVGLGGLIAIRMAVLHPERIMTLTLCTTLFPTETADNLAQYHMTLELASTGDEDGGDHMPVDMVAAGLVVYFGKKGRPEHIHQKWLDTHPFRPSNKALLKKVYSSCIDRKPLEQSEWKRITMPALIIHGSEDMPYPPESAHQNYACMTEADKELHIIQGGAHLLSETEAPIVNDLFIAFLQRKTPSI